MYVYSNPRKGNGLKILLTIVLTMAVTIVVMKYVPDAVEGYQEEEKKNNVERLNQIEERTPKSSGDFTNHTDFVSIVRENMPSVVGISVLKPDGEGILDFNVTEKWGIGTGVIVSEKGYILTNQHLASNRNGTVTVTLDDGKEVKGKIIWNEANLDLAIVKIDERENLKVAVLGNVESNYIGEEVVAIGNPLGLEFQKSVTKGVISGLNRTLKVEDSTSTVVMENLIQTDASINTGNSGGPLINKRGEVIGINTVKITSAEGIGFAVPIDIIKPILRKLETTGEFEEAYLGIFAYDAEIVPYLTKTIETNSGIYVATVTKGGAASKAGIAVGDIIVSIDNIEVNKMTELREYIYEKEPGNEVELKIVRKNKQWIARVILGKR